MLPHNCIMLHRLQKIYTFIVDKKCEFNVMTELVYPI